MPLTLQSRRVGNIPVVTCAGRIVEGAESIALQECINDLLVFGSDIILHLGAVDFIDSSGIGLLARYTSRTRNISGSLKLCAVPPRMLDALRITHLDKAFEMYALEEEAITAFHAGVGSAARPVSLRPDILCVDESMDIQAYVRELLGQAGFAILTAGNLPDGLILLQATRPKVIVISPRLRAQRETRTGEKFNRLADAATVVELPADFSRRDAGEAGQHLLQQVRAAAAVA